MNLFSARLLDPRPADEASETPILDSVSIPVSELSHRGNELPPPQDLVRLPDLPGLEAAEDWLHARGRRTVREAFEWGRDLRQGRLWEPNRFLADVAAELIPGRALDIGCGSGRDAVYLADRGWEVTAFDRLPDSLSMGRTLADRYLTSDARAHITWQQGDAARTLPEGPFGLIVMILYFHPTALEHALRRLGPGGSLVVETFSSAHRERTGHPASATSAVDLSQLSQLAPCVDHRVARHIDVGDRNLAQVWMTAKR